MSTVLNPLVVEQESRDLEFKETMKVRPSEKQPLMKNYPTVKMMPKQHLLMKAEIAFLISVPQSLSTIKVAQHQNIGLLYFWARLGS